MIALGLALLLQIAPTGFTERASIAPEHAVLLLKEKDTLRARSEKARQIITALESKEDFGSLRETLITSVSEANTAVDHTQTDFLKISTGEPQREAAGFFFGDISARYKRLLERLPGLEKPQYAPARDAVFRTFDTNALAYATVAEEKSLTFDLDVRSEPQVGTVSYKRTGDQYRAHPDRTNTIIRNLVYAIWIVKVQKQDYKDQEQSHDPFREKNHVLVFILEKP